ncbi:MAG: outer membrane beta-barrel protein, partial [Bacteroidota bacterium]|nr:outer membrane beta-barrel protein [Bacteroidota bacterium]
MNRIKVIVFLAIFINAGTVFAQRGLQNLQELDYEPYHFGFLLGYNQMGFSIRQDKDSLNHTYSANQFGGQKGQTALLKSAEPNSATGFTIGIVGNLRLAEHFDLRFIPSLSFGERDLTYNYILQEPSTKIDTVSLTKSIKSTLLEFPLDLKYKGKRINNARPYILGGIKYVLDLSSDAKKNTSSQPDDQFTVKLRQTDLYGELGAGF